MTASEWAAILTALGVGAAAKELVTGVWAWLTGRQDAERGRIRRIIAERDHAEAERRHIAEHASELRRMLIEHGTPSTQLPPWPSQRDHETDEPKE